MLCGNIGISLLEFGLDLLTCAVGRAAILKMKKGPANGKSFTDEDWNDEATLTDSPYPYSKVRGICL